MFSKEADLHAFSGKGKPGMEILGHPPSDGIGHTTLEGSAKFCSLALFLDMSECRENVIGTGQAVAWHHRSYGMKIWP